MQLGAVSTARVQLLVKVPADWLPPTDDLNTSYYNTSVQFNSFPESSQSYIFSKSHSNVPLARNIL